jgi:hypothetical protein
VERELHDLRHRQAGDVRNRMAWGVDSDRVDQDELVECARLEERELGGDPPADRSALFRAWRLKEMLADVYRLKDWGAHQFLDRFLAAACRSRIPAFVKLSRTIRAHRDGILAAVELGLSNSKLEGINSKIRLINHRGYGHHSAAAVIAMVYLCCGGITVTLPTER